MLPTRITRKWKDTIKLVLGETGYEGCDESGQDHPTAALVDTLTKVLFLKKLFLSRSILCHGVNERVDE